MLPLAMLSSIHSLICWMPVFLALGSAFVVRDSPLLNSTAPIATPFNPASPAGTLSAPWSTPTGNPLFKPHFESTATDFNASQTTIKPNRLPESKTPDDVGSLIVSMIFPSVRFESTATGFDDFTVNPRIQHTTTTEEARSSSSGGPQPIRYETSVNGFEGEHGVSQKGPEPRITTPPVVTQNSRTLRPVPATSIVVGDRTLTPGGETVTVGQGDSMTRVYLDGMGRPVVVVGTSTSTYQIVPTETVIEGKTLKHGGSPITVGSGFQQTTYSVNPAGETIAIAEGVTSTLQAPRSQAFTIGEITATAQASNYQYVVDSSTLALDHPVTVDGTVISMTTDGSGSTVIIAGDSSTTLPPIAPALLTPAAPEIGISTTIVDGTTEYIIQSQTLAPDHPITINGTAISITTADTTTILVVGDTTTTLEGPPITSSTAGLTTEVAAATPGDVSNANPSATSSKSGTGKTTRWGILSIGIVTAAFVILGLG